MRRLYCFVFRPEPPRYPHDNRYSHRNRHAYAERNSNHPYRNPHAHLHCHSYADRNGDPLSDGDAYPIPAAYRYAHRHLYLYPNPYALFHADFYCNADAVPLADAFGHSLRHQHAMSDILPFLKSLISVSGVSGYETPVADLIKTKWTPLVDEITQSRLGSIHGLKKGALKKGIRPSVMIAAHMDAIGLMVSHIVDGFLHVTSVGGIDPRVLPGTPVIVHASGTGEELYGVIAMPPANLLPEDEGGGVIALKYLLIDTGLTPNAVAKKVRVGDRVSFGTEPVEMSGGCVSGHTLDNRASVAALTVCLEELRSKSHGWDVWAAATVQEEVTLGGARTSAFQIRPTIAVAVDMTFGKGGGSNGYQTFEIGKGVTLGIGPSIHPFLYQRFKEVAERVEVPVHDDLMPEYSSTDADAMQLVAEGIPTMLVSIPQRYMHTPVELVAVKDIQRAGRLLAEFIASLEADFMERIVWD